MNIRLLTVLILSASLWTACNNSDDPDSSCTYCACCETPPLTAEFTLTAGTDVKVYIPNMVVRNAPTAENGRFVITTTDVVEKIATLKITDENGVILHEKSEFAPNDPMLAWDGTKLDGTPFTGTFLYTVTFKKDDGQTQIYTGSACVFDCGDSGFPVDNLPKCGFPAADPGNALDNVIQACF